MLDSSSTDTKQTMTGELLQFDDPDWRGLKHFVEDEVMAEFMWMCETALEDGTRIHAYKHRWNRRYLHLGRCGEAFVYIDADEAATDASRYRPVRLAMALAAVLGPPSWPACGRRW